METPPRAGRQFSKASHRKSLASSSAAFHWSVCREEALRDSSDTLLLGAQGEEKKCPGDCRSWPGPLQACCFLPAHCLSLRASLPKCQLSNFSHYYYFLKDNMILWLSVALEFRLLSFITCSPALSQAGFLSLSSVSPSAYSESSMGKAAQSLKNENSSYLIVYAETLSRVQTGRNFLNLTGRQCCLEV